MVAMNKTYVEYTQKGMGRKSKHVTTKKKKKSAKYKRKAVIEGPKKKKATIHTENKQQNGISNSCPVSNYFKCK